MAPSTSSGAELPRNGKEPMSPTRRPWVPSVMVFAVLAIGALAPRMALTATTPWVHTDMDDYPPGATVYITGGGFLANEMVQLQVLHVGHRRDVYRRLR